MTETQEPEILFDRRGGLAIATLNRPKALNTLTQGMMHAYHPKLTAWAGDPDVAAVVIRATGSRAFCAGGDIRIIWELLQDSDAEHDLPKIFFREEYALNYDIHRFPKPYIALLDGIVMGGGVGLSVHGSHRIVTENTLFAMPETGIGLFPDVGGTYFLTRMEGELGMFLGLTGQRLKAADCLYTGVGTHYVESARMNDLVEALSKVDADGVEAVLADFAGDPGPAPLAEVRETIDRCFGAGSVEDVLAALEAEGTPWAEKLLGRMAGLSPSSLKVTYRQQREGRGLDFPEAMTMEYRLSQACVHGHDFSEGVRALLVDKDNQPKWDPASLAEVSEAEIDAYFAPLGDRDLFLK